MSTTTTTSMTSEPIQIDSPATPTVSERPTSPAADSTGPLQSEQFIERHLGPSQDEIEAMLRTVGYASLDDLSDAAVPDTIRSSRVLDLPPARTEHDVLTALRGMAHDNRVFRSCIGMGYADCITPAVIQRNVLENPGWYTQYTPYQAEISQGRLEALLVFQTMVSELTGLPLANASLLDEATAAAEAMSMCLAIAGRRGGDRRTFFVADDCHPQTIEVVRTRAESLGIELIVGASASLEPAGKALCGALLQYPATDGAIVDHRRLIRTLQDDGALAVMATDLLALTLLTPPGELGADIAVGSAQRFGVPMGAGGPHAAFIATHEEHSRRMPGRIVGVSRDAAGRDAYRMAIQTREQHIKRDRATSNICTAQVLLAIMSAMYAVYHGPEGLLRMAGRVRHLTGLLRAGLRQLGQESGDAPCFDTLRVRPVGVSVASVHAAAEQWMINFRRYPDDAIGISLDETTSLNDVRDILACFNGGEPLPFQVEDLTADDRLDESLRRTGPFLQQSVFSEHRSETEMLRYLTKLQSRDLSLAESMIPLGSCTMKLNATTEMMPVTWWRFARIHPFAPLEQQAGYRRLFGELEQWLARITGMSGVSLQPNAGSQGEYLGLVVIRAWHRSRGDDQRDVCLIPTSAHGTNPASAVVAGLRVVSVACDDQGNIDLADLRAKAETHADTLAALMVTYPSTHGVFEPTIREVCSIVHEHGGQVYLDGANMNAQVGLCYPADLGADVCHLNLHKTFCIPHGGGGPGMGPIAVADHLQPFLPGHPVHRPGSAGEQATGAISAAPYGSASILPISWAYIAMLGAAGLKVASQIAILNANYMARRLQDHFDVLYRGPNGMVAHEFIIDCRQFEKSAGVRIDDIAKRLMDYGFHAPTMSWPVPGTLMIEPTESESRAELDRYCDALIAIREEIRAIEEGRADRDDNVLRNAPHTIESLTTEWTHPYSREDAVYPAPWLRDHKFWPPVGRIENPYGDRNLVCTCG